MRHHNANRTFNRSKNQRVALMKGLVTSLITRERIQTTEAKAKELRPKVEKMITRAKSPTIANKRLLLASLYHNETAVKKLVESIAPRYSDRQGGYTRITKLMPRKGDASKMAVIEFV